MDKETLLKEKEKLQAAYDEYKAMNLTLDLSRGKPSKEQLALSMDYLKQFGETTDWMSEDGVDARNYGGLLGITEGKKIMAELMGTKNYENVIVRDGSSLNIMYDLVSKAYTKGIMGETPWGKLERYKFLCPVPGYDRHFSITETFGAEMINIPIYEDGPDMDLVEELVSSDESIKGIWCVPKFGNPAGVVYSDEVIRRFANLKPKARDFRIFWDNAYAMHLIYPDVQCEILDLVEECEKAGNPDLVYMFGSFSKITFPGSSIAAVACSKANRDDIEKQLFFQTVGPNKMNQLAHARYFRDKAGIAAHMAKHAEIMRPKFEAVARILNQELGSLGIADWTTPLGGYFVSFNTLPGLAKRVVKSMADLGIKLTGAGASFPLKQDPEDRNIRLAPSFAKLEDVEMTIKVFALVVKLETVKKILENEQ